jgi:hypothetical protein
MVGKSEVDNFLHGASGNLAAAVNLQNGTLFAARGSKSRDWPSMQDVFEHPASKHTIEGFQLPFWHDSVKMVIHAHQSLLSLKTIGWDVAITDAGPLIVEANWRYDLDILQVSYKRGFKPILYPLLGF